MVWARKEFKDHLVSTPVLCSQKLLSGVQCQINLVGCRWVVVFVTGRYMWPAYREEVYKGEPDQRPQLGHLEDVHTEHPLYLHQPPAEHQWDLGS